MKHLILCYDLRWKAKLVNLARTGTGNLMVVINPNSGPVAKDADQWCKLIAEVEEAAALNKTRISVQWFGYLDSCNNGAMPLQSVDVLVAGALMYRRSYRAKLKSGRVVIVNNIFFDDCFADDPFKGSMRERLLKIATALSTAELPGAIMANPGEALPADHWLWNAAAFVVCFEGNQESLRGHLGTVPKGRVNAVMIAGATDYPQAARLWKQAAALGCAAVAITERLDYQFPPQWWK